MDARLVMEFVDFQDLVSDHGGLFLYSWDLELSCLLSDITQGYLKQVRILGTPIKISGTMCQWD